MISSQLSQEVPNFDEILSEKDDHFVLSGLKRTSLIRIGRVAVVDQSILVGAIGEINAMRLERIKKRISDWLMGR